MKERNGLITFRHDLHQHPELSGEEEVTARRIRRWMEARYPDAGIDSIAGNGLVCTFSGKRQGPVTLFRAELDAVPVHEDSRFSYRSENPGVSHACGHDGHMAVLAALAETIGRRGLDRGKVLLLFQPAEETGTGAEAVSADPKFRDIRPDYAFALHNLPGVPLGEAAVKSGVIACASEGVILRFSGRSSHAAHPEEGVSPAAAIGRLLEELPRVPDRQEKSEGFSLVTVVGASLGRIAADGSAPFGTSPGEGTVTATLRAESRVILDSLEEIIIKRARVLAREHNLSLEWRTRERFDECRNSDAGAKAVRGACGSAGIECRELTVPYRWSEDFGGIVSAAQEGALFTLGAGEDSPPLHSPNYDFPDSLIETGGRIFGEIIRKLNGFRR